MKMRAQWLFLTTHFLMISAEIIEPCLLFGECHQPSTCDPNYGRQRYRGTDVYFGSFVNDTVPYDNHRVCSRSATCMPAPGPTDDAAKWKSCSNPQAPHYCLGDKHYCVSCIAGQYCPYGTISMGNLTENLCRPGFYCPELHEEIMCPSGAYCPEGSAHAMPCAAGQYCPNGSVTTSLCPPGHYCSTGANATTCPEGHMCPRGSSVPDRCNALLNHCPEGTANRSLSPIFYLIFSAAAVLVAVLIYGGFNVLDGGMFCPGCPCQDHTSEILAAESPHGSPQGSPHGSPREDPTAIKPHCRKRSIYKQGWNPQRISFEVEDLGLKLFNGNRVLDGVDVAIRARTTVAVMGPSGSGKTSLLNVLCGKATYGTTTGKVRINGSEASMSSIISHVGFVPQEDVVHSELTVQENLFYSARIRLDKSKTVESVAIIVDSILELLQITDIRDIIVGSATTRGISGGQRKRVSIGLELVMRPSVLILDEPTSGLDAATSRSIMRSLKSLSQHGVSVVATIHQPRPDVFYSFNSILLLAEGRTVYAGTPTDSVLYMERMGFQAPLNENPADWLLDVLSGDCQYCHNSGHSKVALPQCAELLDLWKGHRPKIADKHEHDIENGDSHCLSPVETHSFWIRFCITLSRDRKRRHALAYKYSLNLLFFIVAGSLVAVVAGDLGQPITPVDKLLYTFINLLVCAAARATFSDNKLIFWKEVSQGYSREAYFFSQNLLDIPIFATYVVGFWLLYVTISTPVAGGWLAFSTMMLMAFSSSGMTYTFAVWLEHPTIPIVGFALIQNIVLSGVFGGLELPAGLPLPYWISPTRFGLEMIAVSCYNKLPRSTTNPEDLIMKHGWELSTTGEDHWSPLWALLLQGVAWRVLACIGLHVCNRRQVGSQPFLTELKLRVWKPYCSWKVNVKKVDPDAPDNSMAMKVTRGAPESCSMTVAVAAEPPSSLILPQAMVTTLAVSEEGEERLSNIDGHIGETTTVEPFQNTDIECENEHTHIAIDVTAEEEEVSMVSVRPASRAG